MSKCLKDDLYNVAYFAYGAYKFSGNEAFEIIYDQIIEIIHNLSIKDADVKDLNTHERDTTGI